MNWPEFENEMKHTVNAHETPIDSDALWEKIREKRRRRALIWLWSAALAVVCSGLLWHQVGNRGLLQHEQSTENPPAHTPVRTLEPEIKLKGNTTQQTPAPVATHFSPSTINGTISTTSDQKSRRFKENINLESPANEPTHLPIPPHIQTNTQTPLPQLEIKEAITTAGAPDTLTQFAQTPPAAPTVPIVVKTDTLAVFVDKTVSCLPVPLRLLPVPEKTLQLPEKQPNFATIPDANPKKIHSYHPSIGFVAGYYRWNSVGTAIPALDSMSRGLETVQGTFQLSLPISSKWTLMTGISYAKTSSLLTWVRTWEAWQPKIIKKYYGNGTISNDLDSALYGIRREIRHYNYWRQIGIPLGLQYRFKVAKVYLAPMAGLQFNFLLPAKGVANNAEYDLDPAVFSAAYQRKWLLQAQAGVEFGWPFGKNWTAVVGPHLQFDCTPRTTKDAQSSERFLQYGIQFGVRYNLVFK